MLWQLPGILSFSEGAELFFLFLQNFPNSPENYLYIFQNMYSYSSSFCQGITVNSNLTIITSRLNINHLPASFENESTFIFSLKFFRSSQTFFIGRYQANFRPGLR